MQFQMMRREAITPSPLNPRKSFDPEKLQALAATMGNGVGIIEPLVVRENGKPGAAELVAGERRWRAAAIAGLEEVPVLVKPLSDAQVLEIMVIENNQREDISPLEEADGYRRLLKLNNTGVASDDTKRLDVDTLAQRLGRSKKYVYDRIKLLSLSAEAQTLLSDGRITAGHGILLARLTPEQQAAAVNPDFFDLGGVFSNDDGPDVNNLSPEAINNRRKKEPGFGLQVVSVRELEAWINRHCRLDVGDRRVQEQFPQLKAVVEKAATVVHITNEYWLDGDVKRETGAARVYTSHEWKRATGGKGQAICNARVMGVVVLGPGRGGAFEVCIDKKCDVHWEEERRGYERSPKSSPSAKSSNGEWAYRGWSSSSGKSQVSWQEQQRKAQEKEDALKKAWDAAVPKLLEACAEKVKGLSLAALAKVIVLGHQRGLFKSAAALLPDAKDAETALRTMALMGFVRDVKENYQFNRDRFAESAKTQLGLDIGPLLKSVQTSAPPTATKGKAAETKKAAAKPVKATKSKAKVKAKKVAAAAKVKKPAKKKAA